jgi:hypothetical protein
MEDEEEEYIPGAAFDFELEGLRTNTTYRVQVDPKDSWSGATTSVLVRVKANVGLSTSASRITAGRTVKLTASVYPNSAAGGTVVFEQLVRGSWRKIVTRTLATSGSYARRASLSIQPGPHTSELRARCSRWRCATARRSARRRHQLMSVVRPGIVTFLG